MSSSADAPMADAAAAPTPAAPTADAAPADAAPAPTHVCGARLGVTPGARLMIREMVLDNFKSYAGEQRVGPFHKCFSSVVGPNGSGKSNVIDAMLFVFGRRAKQLRFSKVSELIHNSASHKSLERACVTVHFQEIFDTDGGGPGGAGGGGAAGGAAAAGDGDTYTVVEGSAFTVARTATRSNASDYYVNGRKCGAKEAGALLKSKGVDLDNNRFLILQGEVEQISLMRPRGEGGGAGDTGLLEYLEDIIGTDALVPRIEEHGKRLDELNDRRQGMIAKLKGVERDRAALEGRKLEAEAYLSKQAERLRLRLAGNMAHRRRHEVGLADVAAKTAEFQARLEHERAKCRAFDGELRAAEDALAAADGEHAALASALEGAQADFKQFELKDTKLRMDLQHARAKQKKAQAKAKADAEATAALEADVARLEATEIPASARLVEALQGDLAAAEATVERLQTAVHGEVEKLRAQLGAVKAELAPWEQQMREVQARVDVATSERDLVLREQAEAKARLDQAREALAQARLEADAKEREILALRAELESARSDEAFAREAAEGAAAAEAQLEESLRALRARAGSLRQDASSATTANAALAALLDAKRQGAIPGLHGRLGDLGAVDPRLDAAISTSCPQLDHIVVETMVDAQKGVELLRKGQLGVRSFLILERQRHYSAKVAAGPPAGLPQGCVRLFDAVKPANDAARLAFYSVLRETVVAETTQQARDLVFARDSPFRRAVTLSGAVVEAGGTLTGGGQPRRGRMRVGDRAPAASGAAAAADAKAAAAELAQAERELAAGDERLRRARDEREAGLKAAAACAKRAAQLELALPKAAAVVEARRDAARDLEGRLGELEAAAVARPEDEKRARELARGLSDEAINLAKLRASSGGLSKRAQELQAKIEQAGGEPLRKARALVGTLTKKIADAEGDGVAKGVQAKAAAKQLLRLRKEGGKADGDAAKLEKEAAGALAALKAIETDALAVMARVEELREAAASGQQAAEAARAARDAKSAEVGVIRSVEGEVEAALAKLAAAQRDHAAEARRLARELEADAEALGAYLPRLAALEDAAAADEEGEAAAREEERAGDGMDVDGEEEEEEGDEARPATAAKKGGSAAAAAAAVRASTGGLPPGTALDARGVPCLSDAQLDAVSTDDLFYRVAVLDEQLRAMSPDLDAIEAFAEKARDFAQKAAELAAATSERDAARREHDALRKARLDGFMEGFNAISLKLKEMYQMITLGGDAELELVDTLDPFSEGIVFSVRPPKKSWKHIANLSGGEKTLSSLSLVFALHHYKPTPLYVMDEIDAALDFKNVSIVGHYIKERTKNAQFVIISLRNNMFELADRLVGIYKTDNATKTVAINPGSFAVGGAAAAAKAGAAAPSAKAAAAGAADGDGEGGENRRPARRALAAA